jgi:hypothetical protein
VWIIEGGAFFSGTDNGTTLGGAFSGLSVSGIQQVILIHEFFRVLGLVGPDRDGQKYTLANGATVEGSAGLSRAIRDNCFN